MQKLYKVSQSTGKVQVWCGTTNQDVVKVTYGVKGGKMQTKEYKAVAKNVGRANATTPEQQAEIELKALYEAQVTNKHYHYSEEEAIKASKDCRVPRKITNYKDRYNKMSDVLLSSVKKDGSRGCVVDGVFYSKTGREETIKVPHLAEAVKALGSFATFDAEVYAEGLTLQRIRSAWTKPVKTDKDIIKIARDRAIDLSNTNKNLEWDILKAIDFLGYLPNEDAKKLKFFIFDIPTSGSETFEERVEMMHQLEEVIEDKGLSDCFSFLYPILTKSHEDRMHLLGKVCAEGSEGLVHYEPKGVYEFGKRSTNVAKSKPRYDSECKVVDVTEDKSGEGVLHCVACDKLNNVKFKCKMKVTRRDGKRYERDYATMCNLIGKWVTFSYVSLSVSGTPLKPVAEEERECDEHGNPLA